MENASDAEAIAAGYGAVTARRIINSFGQNRFTPDVAHRLQVEIIRALTRAATEYCWLIEFKPSVSKIPAYYGKVLGEGLGLTTDHNAAIRFVRKEDAEAIIENIGWTEAFASEHGHG